MLSPSIHVHPGETVEVQIGGVGRSVTGKLVAPAGVQIRSWTNQVTLARLHVEWADYHVPADLTGSAVERWKLEFEDTDAGRVWFRDQYSYDFKVGVDGSFTIPEVLPGKYRLFVDVGQGYLGFGPGLEHRFSFWPSNRLGGHENNRAGGGGRKRVIPGPRRGCPYRRSLVQVQILTCGKVLGWAQADWRGEAAPSTPASPRAKSLSSIRETKSVSPTRKRQAGRGRDSEPRDTGFSVFSNLPPGPPSSTCLSYNRVHLSMKALDNLARKNSRGQKRAAVMRLHMEMNMAPAPRPGGQIHVGDDVASFYPLSLGHEDIPSVKTGGPARESSAQCRRRTNRPWPRPWQKQRRHRNGRLSLP